jgi:tetratricopeptide (TPR) repeat protein
MDKAERYVGNDVKGRIRLIRAKAGYLVQRGYDVEAAELLLEALRLARDIGDANEEVGVSWLLLNSGELDADQEIPLLEEARRRAGENVSTLNRLALMSTSFGAMMRYGRREEATAFLVQLKQLAQTSRHVRGEGFVAADDAVLLSFDGNLEPMEVNQTNFQYAATLNLRFRRWSGQSFEPLPEPKVPDDIRSVLFWYLEIAGFLERATPSEAALRFSELRRRVLEEMRLLGRRNLAGALDFALLLEDEEAVNAAYAQLSTYETRRFLFWNALTPTLPLLMGQAAMFLGRQEEAISHFNAAIELCDALGNRPELALTRLSLAELLLDHYPDEHDAAIEHLDFAIAELRAMKMQPALERALGRRGLLKA